MPYPGLNHEQITFVTIVSRLYYNNITFVSGLYNCLSFQESIRMIVLFNRNLPTRCHKTSLRAFVSWIAGMALSMR